MRTNTFLSFIISTLLHLLIVLLAIIQIKQHQELTKFNINQEEILPSYISQIPATIKPIIKQQKIIPHAIPISKSRPMQITKPTPLPAKAQEKSIGNNENVPELLALLHAAIEQHKQYPATAMEMEREGTVTLRFTLYRDGNIQDLEIQKSSGTASLDTAAIEAVKAATPFKNISKYLQQPQNYQIDVVFELA